MYNYKGFDIKTSVNEMTVEQFEKTTVILNNEKITTIERYFNLLSYLGIPDGVLDEITDDEFFNIIKQFNKDQLGNKELIPSFEHNGVKYVAYEGEEFKLKAKDLILIEKNINSSSSYFASTIAILFKPEGTDLNLVYAPRAIEQRTKIVNTLNAADFYPYIVHITGKIISKTEQAVLHADSK
jgi:hypothetical protein